jgi:cysteine desulfurase
MKTIYVDNNATTQMAPEVMEAMLPYFRDYYGNPSSMHTFGGQVGPKVREAREQVAELLGAGADEIIFTSCGSESDNTAIRSALASNPDKRHIVISRVEHPAIRSLAASLAKQGYRVTEIPVDSQGHLNLEKLQESLTPDTALFPSCGPIMKPGLFSPSKKLPRWSVARGSLFIPTPYRRREKSLSTCKKRPLTCSPSRDTNCTRQRESGPCTSAGAPNFPRS